MNKKYDVLVVGAGLYGSSFARICKDAGLNVCVIDKRTHVGGNVYDEKDKATKILIQKYGAHIFRTSNEDVWNFLNRFTKFKKYVHEVKASYKDKIYSLPFNMNTFHEIYGCETIDEAKKIIEEKISKYKDIQPKNLEEQALKLAGEDIYNILIKGYSEKQWGKSCTEIPADTMRRIKFRYEYNNDYFTETHEGIPHKGFTDMINNMLEGIEVHTGMNYYDFRKFFDDCADTIVFTGRIDEYFDFCFGELEYRSLRFEEKSFNKEYYQKTSVTNYTDIVPEYTRSIEHKHFLNQKSASTIVTFEYPAKFKEKMIPFYPINNEKNNNLYNKYKEKASELKSVIFGGTLGTYQYLDMNEVVQMALKDANKYIKENKNEN